MAGKANVLFISIKYVYKIPNQSQKDPEAKGPNRAGRGRNKEIT